MTKLRFIHINDIITIALSRHHFRHRGLCLVMCAENLIEKSLSKNPTPTLINLNNSWKACIYYLRETNCIANACCFGEFYMKKIDFGVRFWCLWRKWGAKLMVMNIQSILFCLMPSSAVSAMGSDAANLAPNPESVKKHFCPESNKFSLKKRSSPFFARSRLLSQSSPAS